MWGMGCDVSLFLGFIVFPMSSCCCLKERREERERYWGLDFGFGLFHIISQSHWFVCYFFLIVSFLYLKYFQYGKHVYVTMYIERGGNFGFPIQNSFHG